MTAPSTARRAAPVTLFALLRAMLLGAFALGLVALAAPPLVGWQVLTEQTGSMAPVLLPGDVVVVRPVSPSSIRAGDVVTFPSPEGTGKLITHRVVSTIPAGNDVTVVTRGDANNDSERWTVKSDGRIGRAVYRLPAIGRGLGLLRLPMARLLLLVVPIVLLAGIELAKIWRSDTTDSEGSVPREDRTPVPAFGGQAS